MFADLIHRLCENAEADESFDDIPLQLQAARAIEHMVIRNTALFEALSDAQTRIIELEARLGKTE